MKAWVSDRLGPLVLKDLLSLGDIQPKNIRTYCPGPGTVPFIFVGISSLHSKPRLKPPSTPSNALSHQLLLILSLINTQ